MRGIGSGYGSADTRGALVTPLLTLCNPGATLWLRVEVRVRPCHGVWWVRASMRNDARMYTEGVRESPRPNIAWSPVRSDRRRRRQQQDGRYVCLPIENIWGSEVRCHPPRLSQRLICQRAIETDGFVVQSIAEKAHGVTPWWLHVVTDRSDGR